MKKELVKQEDSRLTLLEECEHRIGNYLRRGLEATVGIGRELKKISDMELYLERGCKSLNEYCFDCHNLEARSVSRFLAVADTVALLKDHGLELPSNETQVLELARIDPEQQPIIWERVLKAAEVREERVTAFTVRKAIDLAIDNVRQPLPAKTPAKGVRTPLDEPEEEEDSDLSAEQENGSEGRMELPSRISLTERGEAALERIRRLCGDVIAEAIAELRLQISERELITWAEYDDPARLGRLVAKGFTVAKAIGFDSSSVTEKTTVYKLLQLAHAHDGHYETEAEGARITVELLAMG
jgi:hypothetical protein